MTTVTASAPENPKTRAIPTRLRAARLLIVGLSGLLLILAWFGGRPRRPRGARGPR